MSDFGGVHRYNVTGLYHDMWAFPSDTPGVVQRMKQAYPALRTVGDMVDLGDLTPAQGDLVELYAMSRADRIVAPIISAFSTAAARLSGR